MRYNVRRWKVFGRCVLSFDFTDKRAYRNSLIDNVLVLWEPIEDIES